jgi:hypothetical protein
MSRFSLLTLFVVLAIALSACGAGAPAVSAPSPDTYTSPNLDVTYSNALPARMQLALGTLKLADTNTPVSAEQAAKFLPLWQALQSMTTSGNSASAEVNALLSQIEAVFSAEQMTAIKDMKMTFTDMTTWASANGVTLGSGSGQPGQGQGMSAEARATRQAENGKTGESGPGSGASAALTSAAIKYLETLK